MGSCVGKETVKAEKTLFDNYKVGDITLSNRIVVSAMTRNRADPKDGIPNDLMAEYYAQRASAGLILTECAAISNAGNSFPGSGSIYTKEQAAGWKKVTDAVHKKGSKIALQIWHGGRSADPAKTGEPNIGPSPIAIRAYNDKGEETVSATPKEMTKDDIKQVIQEFVHSAKLAKEAGFDALEIHGSNGYLIDQFIRDASNQRKDEYGGSVENRCRFALEVVDALVGVFGAGRIGIKLGPVGRYQYMYDSNPIETYSYLIKKLNERKIAFIELTEPNDDPSKKGHFKNGKEQIPNVVKQFRSLFDGTIIANGGYKPDTALKVVQEGFGDLVSFATLYLSNPDLVERIKNNWPLNTTVNWAKVFWGGADGYTDYPNYDPKTQA